MPRNEWTADEIDFLRTHYRDYTYDELAKMLHRPKGGTKTKIAELLIKENLPRKNPIEIWTVEEKKLLLLYYQQLTNPDLAKLLNRSIRSVTGKLREMKLTNYPRWSDEEIVQLKKRQYNDQQAALNSRRSSGAFRAKRRRMNVSTSNHTTHMRKWTRKELTFLRENHTKLRVHELASHLQRTEASINWQLSKIQGKPLTRQERSQQLLSDALDLLTDEEIQRMQLALQIMKQFPIEPKQIVTDRNVRGRLFGLLKTVLTTKQIKQLIQDCASKEKNEIK